MECPEIRGEFDAHRLMQLHLQLQPQPLSKVFQVVLAANLVLMFAPVLLMNAFPKQPGWLAVIEAGMPWVAVAAALCFPKLCVVFADQGGSRLPLFGVWFFSFLALMGGFGYASLVRKLPALEMGLVAGAVLFAWAAIALLRAKSGLWHLALMLPPALGCGYGTVFQANCLLDHSSTTVYRTVVSRKSEFKGLHLDLEPWGPAPEAKSLLTDYRVSVPRATFDAVRVGGPVCVMQREGGLGAWYTAQGCP